MKTITAVSQRERFDDIIKLRELVWPDFIRLPAKQVRTYYDDYPDFQIALVSDTGELIAVANSLPMYLADSLENLPAEGLSTVLHSVKNLHGAQANLLCGISMSIHPKYQGHGISRALIEALKASAREKGMDTLVLPLRPTKKSLLPLTPMEDYIKLTDPEGRVLDPWIRVHLSMGAKVIKVCPNSAVVQASLEEWKKWTGVTYLEDGEYPFKGGLVPLVVNKELNEGTYVEPNVWVAYQG